MNPSPGSVTNPNRVDIRNPIAAPKPIIIDQMTPEWLPAFDGTLRGINNAGQTIHLAGGAVAEEWWIGGFNGTKDKPDLAKVESSVKVFAPDTRMSFDIEGQHEHDLRKASKEDVDKAIELKRNVILAAKKSRPDLQSGLYATIPCEYWSAVLFGAAQEAKQKQSAGKPLTDIERWLINVMPTLEIEIGAWQAACRYCKPLIEVCDFIEIDCYPRYNRDGSSDAADIINDRLFVTANVRVARSLAAPIEHRPRKPVYASISNQIFETDEQPLLSAARFRALCESLKAAGVDGVIVWNWTRGQPLTPQQVECMKIAVEVFGKLE